METTQMKQMRLLENRLDKAMIKYNKAQSIRKTYERLSKDIKTKCWDATINSPLRGVLKTKNMTLKNF